MVTVFPEYISLTDWAASLIVDNPSSYVPVLQSEDKWQEWGAVVAGTGAFRRSNVPSPFSIYKGNRKDNFKDWKEWARVVYLLLNNIQNSNNVEV